MQFIKFMIFIYMNDFFYLKQVMILSIHEIHNISYPRNYLQFGFNVV